MQHSQFWGCCLLAFLAIMKRKSCVLAMPEQLTDANWSAIAPFAYSAYGAVVNFKNYQGQPMPPFDQLPETIKQAWEQAARSVGECLNHPELIAEADQQTGQQIVNQALQEIGGGETL